MNPIKFSHPHLTTLRDNGFADVADAFEADATDAIANPDRCRDAAKMLSELPGGSTLRRSVEDMSRRNHRRQHPELYSPQSNQ
jgi:hypothetical protein